MEIKSLVLKALEFILEKLGYSIYKHGERFKGVCYTDIINALSQKEQINLASTVLQKREKHPTEFNVLEAAKIQKRFRSAINNRNFEKATYFLGEGASASDINYSNLQYSSRKPEVLELLIKHGFDVNQTDSDLQTPLHLVAGSGDIELAKLFLAHGANPTAKDREGFTALELAEDRSKSNENYQEMIDLLSSHTEKKVLESSVSQEDAALKRKTMKI